MENLEQPKWYVVHTYSGYENSVETDLRNMIENNNLQDYIFDIKIHLKLQFDFLHRLHNILLSSHIQKILRLLLMNHHMLLHVRGLNVDRL